MQRWITRLGWTAFWAAVVLIPCAMGLVIAGPASNLYSATALESLSGRYPGGQVTVANLHLSDELAILSASNIFEIVAPAESHRVVQLQPMQSSAVCGTPLLRTYATWGLVSSRIPVTYTFSFTLQEGEKSQVYQFALRGERRVSTFQRLLKPFRSDEKTWGAMLASEYQRHR